MIEFGYAVSVVALVVMIGVAGIVMFVVAIGAPVFKLVWKVWRQHD